MSKPAGLGGHATGDFLEISGYIREFDSETANPVRKLIDQSLSI
jgi:hypothetical protein